MGSSSLKWMCFRHLMRWRSPDMSRSCRLWGQAILTKLIRSLERDLGRFYVLRQERPRINGSVQLQCIPPMAGLRHIRKPALVLGHRRDTLMKVSATTDHGRRAPMQSESE